MPAKAKRKKNRYTGQRRAQAPARTQSAAVASGTASAPAAPARTAAATGTAARPAAGKPQPAATAPPLNQNVHLGRELGTIAAIAGVLIVVLVILSFVLK